MAVPGTCRCKGLKLSGFCIGSIPDNYVFFRENCVCVSSGTCTCTPWQYLAHVVVRLSGSCIDSIPEVMSAFWENCVYAHIYTCMQYLNSTYM